MNTDVNTQICYNICKGQTDQRYVRYVNNYDLARKKVRLKIYAQMYKFLYYDWNNDD